MFVGFLPLELERGLYRFTPLNRLVCKVCYENLSVEAENVFYLNVLNIYMKETTPMKNLNPYIILFENVQKYQFHIF